MSQLHQAHCLRQCGRHCRDKGDQQQAADDGHIVHKHIRHDLGKRGAAHLDTHEQGVAHGRGDVVNAERAKYGLAALTLDETLCGYARVKSQDMHDQGYFSHTSPTYGSPFDMMRSFGVSYRSAGENIAMGYSTPEAVVAAWINSEGHRANILSANYTTLGVGYVEDGGYWTQWFIG